MEISASRGRRQTRHTRRAWTCRNPGSVGAPDGGPGLPGTGWSLEHGDIRIPHFVGLHAMQILPLLAIALRRRQASGKARVRVVMASAASYAALVGILLWQALRGQSLVQHDGATFAVLIVWAMVSAAAVWFASTRETRPDRAIVMA